MSNYIASDTDLTAVANAIRTKGNTQSPLEFPSGFESAIANLGGDDSTLAALIDRSITEIEIPSGVTAIGAYSFASCKKINNITIPNGVTYISMNAFYSCQGLNSVELPNTLTELATYAFGACNMLTSITCHAVNPPTLGSNAFYNVPATCAIYVPAESVDEYKAASKWSDRAAYIQAIPT